MPLHAVDSWHWVESEAIATSLYGSGWASRVVDVPDAFFVNYSVGSSRCDGGPPRWFLGDDTGARYVVWGGQARLLSDAAFAANWFDASNVLSTSIVYPMGAAVVGREAMLSDTVSAASVTLSAVPCPWLWPLTPQLVTVPKNASAAQLAKFTLTAGSAVTVTGLKMHRVGVGGNSGLSPMSTCMT